jgi:hypothetical protein
VFVSERLRRARDRSGVLDCFTGVQLLKLEVEVRVAVLIGGIRRIWTVVLMRYRHYSLGVSWRVAAGVFCGVGGAISRGSDLWESGSNFQIQSEGDRLFKNDCLAMVTVWTG